MAAKPPQEPWAVKQVPLREIWEGRQEEEEEAEEVVVVGERGMVPAEAKVRRERRVVWRSILVVSGWAWWGLVWNDLVSN